MTIKSKIIELGNLFYTQKSVMADLIEELVQMIDKPTPTPDVPTDALVEAALNIIKNTFSSERKGFFDVAEDRIVDLQKALADHEKAVPKQSDDALVEAVKKAVTDLNSVTGSSDDFTAVGLGVVEDLETALAAHVHTDGRMTEKAGA